MELAKLISPAWVLKLTHWEMQFFKENNLKPANPNKHDVAGSPDHQIGGH